MLLKHKLSLLLVAAVVVPLGACKKGAGKKNAQPAGSASAVASAAAPAPASTALTVDALLTKLAPTVCSSMEQCKNDKVKAIVAMSGMMIAGFGAMDKPALKKQMDGVDATMKKGKRWMPNKQECATIGSVALQVLGMTPEALKPKIGKTVKFDGDKAAQCLKELSSISECKTEVKLAKEPKLGDIDKFDKELGKSTDAETKACNEMFTGMVEPGGDCEQDYECKGDHAKCKMDHKKKKKVCKAAKHHAK